MRPAHVTLDGKQWVFDEESWTLKDWFIIKNEIGYDRVPFLNGVLSEDPIVLQGLIWYLQIKADGKAPRRETIDFRPSDLGWEPILPAEAVSDGPPSDAEDDGGTASAKTETATCSPSPSTAT